MKLVEKSAEVGQGKSYFAKDNNQGLLNSLVIQALQDSTTLFLKNCTASLSGKDQENAITSTNKSTSLLPIVS